MKLLMLLLFWPIVLIPIIAVVHSNSIKEKESAQRWARYYREEAMKKNKQLVKKQYPPLKIVH